MTDRKRDHLTRLFGAAVDAARPENCLPPHLPVPPEGGRVVVLAAGKAAGAMAKTAEDFYRDQYGLGSDRLTGIAVARHGYGQPTSIVGMVEAGHPVPDRAGIEATEKTLRLAAEAGPDDLVLVLLSGGGSANWIAPADGVTLDEKQVLTRQCLRSGATISQINTLRKHLSRIKGGRLARAVAPARLLTLAISDVPGDDPDVIASGPTVPDTSTLADARAVVERFRLDLPASVRRALDEGEETPKPGDPAFANAVFELVATPALSLAAAAKAAQALGYRPAQLGDALEGEARALAAEQVAHALAAAEDGAATVFLSGGEVTVTIRGDGRGGPNQEYALGAAIAMDGERNMAGLAADTDGTDGGTGLATDPAGAIFDGRTAGRARDLGLDPQGFLDANDSTDFFARLGDLVEPGPTYTNVNDFRALIVDRTR